jgi:hypothetical protein
MRVVQAGARVPVPSYSLIVTLFELHHHRIQRAAHLRTLQVVHLASGAPPGTDSGTKIDFVPSAVAVASLVTAVTAHTRSEAFSTARRRSGARYPRRRSGSRCCTFSATMSQFEQLTVAGQVTQFVRHLERQLLRNRATRSSHRLLHSRTLARPGPHRCGCAAAPRRACRGSCTECRASLELNAVGARITNCKPTSPIQRLADHRALEDRRHCHISSPRESPPRQH